MKLTREGIKERDAWQEKGIRLPQYDVEEAVARTRKEPEWIHFGAGNIFRGFIGSIAQKLLNAGETDTGIIAVETFDFDIIDKIYQPYDNLTLNVMMDVDSGLDLEVLGGVVDGVKASDYARLYEIAKEPSLKMMSFTITEKGYAITASGDQFLPIVEEDIKDGAKAPKHAMSIVAAMLYERYTNGACPLAVVSMDNCSHNGEKLQASVMAIAKACVENGTMDKGFLAYLNTKVSFPWSMIDKITPRPSDKVKAQLQALGVEDMDAVVTGKNTYIAPFVNAEIPEYLVVEDNFPNGRPPLEKAGVYLTSRETVNKAETMKVTTCLNPLHTALAVFGCTLGYTTIWEEMQDACLKRLVQMIADEGMKVVIDPKIIDPQAFVTEVIEKRLPNPNIPDAPQRIATDTSQKVGIRYGETIKSYMHSDSLSPADLTAIPMAIAGWLRYLLGVDDNGNAFERSQDPMLDELTGMLEGIRVGQPDSLQGQLKGILSNKALFGTDLYKAGIGDKIEMYFASMIKTKGAVREALNAL